MNSGELKRHRHFRECRHIHARPAQGLGRALVVVAITIRAVVPAATHRGEGGAHVPRHRGD